jgi:hypothetical protein
MPNKGGEPLMNILDRAVARRGEGVGEWRCRYWCNNDKKTKYIAYQYGKRFTSEEAFNKVLDKKNKLIKIIQRDFIIRKEQKEEADRLKILNKPPPQKRGRKPKVKEIITTIDD